MGLGGRLEFATNILVGWMKWSSDMGVVLDRKI